MGEHERVDGKTDSARRQGKRNAFAGQMRPQIGIGEHRPNTGQSARLRHIHARQPRMRERAAEECRVQEARQADVIDKPAAPTQQRCVLHAQHAFADQIGQSVTQIVRSPISPMQSAGRRAM
jgi:hypothetical protein